VKDTTVSLADAKARLSELAELAAAGESVVITKRGKPVVRLSRVSATRRPVDLGTLRALTARMPRQKTGAGELMRGVRDDSRH